MSYPTPDQRLFRLPAGYVAVALTSDQAEWLMMRGVEYRSWSAGPYTALSSDLLTRYSLVPGVFLQLYALWFVVRRYAPYVTLINSAAVRCRNDPEFAAAIVAALDVLPDNKFDASFGDAVKLVMTFLAQHVDGDPLPATLTPTMGA